MKFKAIYVLQKIIACNMEFVNDNQQNLLWQRIALKIILATIPAASQQCGCRVTVNAIRIFGKSIRTCIES